VVKLEAKLRLFGQVLLNILHYSRVIVGQVSLNFEVRRIGKEQIRLSVVELTLDQGYGLVRRSSQKRVSFGKLLLAIGVVFLGDFGDSGRGTVIVILDFFLFFEDYLF